MNFISFNDDPNISQFDVAILIKETSMSKRMLENYYVDPLRLGGVPQSTIMAAPLIYFNNKASKSTMLGHIDDLVPYLQSMKVKYIMCADANYYKVLTKQTKAEIFLDEAKPCVIKGLEDVKVIYNLNYSSLAYNPAQSEKVEIGNNTMIATYGGVDSAISFEFTAERYPVNFSEIKAELESLHQYDELACDIEAFSLRLGEAGIASISFAESTTSGSAFLVDYKPTAPTGGLFGTKVKNKPVRKLLREFFETYKGNLTWHGSAYDLKQLVWELFMDHPLDYKGMVDGTQLMTKNFDDTRMIAFLCLNSTSRPDLGLKALAYPYAGNYGEEEIKNVLKIEPFQLLKYNLKDTCCTLWVKDQYWDRMIAEKQYNVYQDFLDMQRVLIQTELHGMPMNEQRRIEVEEKFIKKRESLKSVIVNSDYVFDAETILIDREVGKANAKLKKLRKTADDFNDFQFNPGSSTQLQVLLHSVMELPVLKLTPNKEPKTDADTLKLLIHKAEDPEAKELIQTIIEYSELCTVINTFMKAFAEGMLKADGRRYLHGNFNIAKVKSGRLSSSEPNLQNLPSGSTYGKDIKSIFEAPIDKLFAYSDFNSLEDYISALLSKDPNKMKVYLGHEIFEIVADGKTILVRDDSEIRHHGEVFKVIDYAQMNCKNIKEIFPFDGQYDEMFKEFHDVGKGKVTITKVGNSNKYDGHSLRAFFYFPSRVPGIVDNVKSINMIKLKFEPVRGDSKGPTFMMTYGGSEHGLVDKFGFSKKEAKEIYNNYHTLYAESDAYTQRRIDEAAELGYMVLAFGLRIRCPLLKNTIRKSGVQAKGTSEDERTLGNAIGQSYGQLNNRAMVAFMDKVWASEYRYAIFPIAPIHDASYYILDDDIGAVKFLNENLIKEMQWQEDPLIAHDRVKIGAELDIAYPSWAKPFTIPNNATKAQILELRDKHLAKLEEEANKKKAS